jgi:hypothetical protein
LFDDIMVVGGNYKDTSSSGGVAVFVQTEPRSRGLLPPSRERVIASTTPPHGFRSSVQWSDSLKAWIAAGTNGSDISRDDGKTWQPLDDGNWNALSLPFIVGPNGRIARLNAVALPNP